MSDWGKEQVEKLIREAEEKGLWLFCGYQDLWFSPAELRKAQSDGRFRWGPDNWRLRDPREMVTAAEYKVRAAQEHLEHVKARLRGK